MHLKRKSPKQRLSVKKTCLRDEKVAANSLLMLSESSGPTMRFLLLKSYRPLWIVRAIKNQ